MSTVCLEFDVRKACSSWNDLSRSLKVIRDHVVW